MTMNDQLRKDISKELLARVQVIKNKNEWYEYCLGFAKAFSLTGNFEAGSYVLENLQPLWQVMKGVN